MEIASHLRSAISRACPQADSRVSVRVGHINNHIPHSSILAWEVPWTEEPGRLQFMRSQRVSHNSVTKQQQTHGTTARIKSDFSEALCTMLGTYIVVVQFLSHL